MARTALTVQSPTTTMVTPSFQSADSSNGNSIAITGKGIALNVKNTNAATRTLTLTTTNTRDGFSLTSPTFTIAANTGDHMIMLSSTEVSALAVAGVLQLDWSASANVTLAVYELRQ